MLAILLRGVVPLVLVAALTAQAPTFRFAGIFGDHMVLPHGRANVFGFGTAGDRVVVSQPAGGEVVAEVTDDGRWRCQVATGAPGAAIELTATCGDQKLVLRDVLVGEVWLGSGQSNMEMPVGDVGWWKTGVVQWQQEVAAADLPRLRLFTVENAIAAMPAADVRGTWAVCSPATAKTFSATAFFFGRHLHQELDRPIGLVASSWGGTVCEAWTSAGGLRDFPEFAGALTELAAQGNDTPQSRGERLAAYWAQVDAKDAAATAAWRPAPMPHVWGAAAAGDFDGVAFYRCAVEIPAAWAGQDVVLELPPIDDMDTVWLGDRKVAGTEDHGAWAQPRSYAIAGKHVVAGRTELRVRVVDTGGEGGINGASPHLRLAKDANATLPLSAWEWRRGVGIGELPRFPAQSLGDPNVPSVLWNGMIAPLVPFSFTGAIWYQGESNRGRHQQYRRLFPAMIADWRRAFASALPFFFVQIAPFHYGDNALQTPLIRDAQAAALELPATGMVVTMDVGDPRDIHPRDKQSVGKRLALQALAKVHGRDVPCDGPRCTAVIVDGDGLRLQFDCKAGLRAGEVVQGFELAGEDGAFVAVEATVAADAVLVRSPKVPVPTQVRYGWHEDAPATFVDAAGLPAWPFTRVVDR